MERIVCPLCRSPDYTPYATVQDRLMGIPGQFTLVRCTRCELHYLNPRPTMEELAHHYPRDYDPYTTALPDELPFFRRLSVRYGLRKRCRAVQRFKRGGRLLEIGCANGLFLDAMRRVGSWHVQGVEVNEPAARYARERLGLDVVTGELADAEFPDEAFDAVAMWDVLEHVHDPQATLHEIYRVLKPDGVLILRLPLLDSWDRRLFGRYWVGWDAPRHLTTFSLRTLRQMLRQASFCLEHAASISGSYPAFSLSLRFWAQEHLPQRARHGLRIVLDSLVVRAAVSPFFYLMDRLALSTVVTVVARLRGSGRSPDMKESELNDA
jgi:SAM-dependent methyltransferase